MTLKEELEILRGEPIEVFTGDPMDIPCVETSDPDKLCKNPVVSVHMLAYNHEPYIRQAIEGVMMQQTDFEFELVIGEDASQDKTREICFEYQKKYPDKIRVLWWHENVSKFGGNGRRNRARLRGEFIAFCEGDDYWIDPLKLQKQVDVMRKCPNVGLCFTNAQVLQHETGKFSDWDGACCYSPNEIPGKRFFAMYCYGIDPGYENIDPAGFFIMTASCMIRKRVYIEVTRRYDLFSWRLALGDKQILLGMATSSDTFYIKDQTVVYRRHQGSTMSLNSRRVYRDSALVKIFLSIEGPYDYKVPIDIIEVLISHRTKPSSNALSGSSQCIVKAVRHLFHECNVTFQGVSWRRRIRWLLFLCIGQEWLLFRPLRFWRRLRGGHK